MGKKWRQCLISFSWAPKSMADGDWSHEIKRYLLLGRKAMTNLANVLKKQQYHFADKCLYSQSYGFSIIHVRMWEGRGPKNWCFWTVVLEKTLESSLDNNEIKPVNPKEIQPWIFVGMTSLETDAPILWPLDAKRQLIGKDSDAGKDWGREKWVT